MQKLDCQHGTVGGRDDDCHVDGEDDGEGRVTIIIKRSSKVPIHCFLLTLLVMILM